MAESSRGEAVVYMGDDQRFDYVYKFVSTNPWRDDVEEWILQSPSSRPIVNLCQLHCLGEVASCGFAFLALSGGYFETIRYDTPLQSVIPQEVFLNSPRAKNMVLRRTALARAETNLEWLGDSPDLPGISQCAADLIAAERADYN